MVKRPATADHRPALRISRDTWDREDKRARERIVASAAQQGFRLVVVSRDGDAWAPLVDPKTW